MILGIDEVGRGPWAGPLVMGAVVLGCEINGLTDSKKLSKKRREELNEEIIEKAAGVGLGWVQADEIDILGLASALEVACRRAVEALELAYQGGYSEIIVDGTINFLKNTGKGAYVTTMKKADLLIPSVSAASIVAKVARDKFMEEQHTLYPEYGFASHVGYGTAAHRAAIEKYGVTPLHRLSFAPLQKYKSNPPVKPSRPRQVDRRRGFFSKFSLQSAELASAQTSSIGQEKIEKTSGSANNTSNGLVSLTTRAVGNASETIAAEQLVHLGHEIIERNWKTKYCEIDIVSLKGDIYYFTEVKHRRNAHAGGGVAAITSKKLSQMKFAVELYAKLQKISNADLRLLVIATSGEDPVFETLLEIE